MPRNYVLSGELKQAAIASGALESSMPDWELDVEVYRVTNRSEIPLWVERAKTDFPHRFAVQSDHDAELCRAAFIAKNKTAEGRLYNAVGEQRYNELKRLYANGLPESEKKKLNGSADHSKNPWAPIETNISPKTGRYTDDAIRRQMSLCRAVGPEKAAQVAAAVGSKLGDIRAVGFRRVA